MSGVSGFRNFLTSKPAAFLSKFSSPGTSESSSESVHATADREIKPAIKTKSGITRELFEFSGFSFQIPVNYLEDFREKVSSRIPAFYDSYLETFKNKLAGYESTKEIAKSINPKSPKVWIVLTDVIMIVVLSVMQQFYFQTMGLYLMNIETIKLLADGRVKDGAANFALGAVVYCGYAVFATLATLGMLIRYGTGKEVSVSATKGVTLETPTATPPVQQQQENEQGTGTVPASTNRYLNQQHLETDDNV